MSFKGLNQTNSETSPAVELHTRYGRLSIGKSKIADWRNLLQRDFSYTDLLGLISWLETHRNGSFPSSTTIVRNAKAMVEESKTDPVACRVPVTQEALGLWELICQADRDIEPEFVADALNRYRDYLATKPPLYEQLPPALDFVFDWFTVTARYGSPSMRRFYLDHPKFKEYLTLVKRRMENG